MAWLVVLLLMDSGHWNMYGNIFLNALNNILNNGYTHCIQLFNEHVWNLFAMDLIAIEMKKITKKTHGILNLRPMDKYIKLIIFQLNFLILPCMVYVSL